jgi:hypothetical protein
MGARSVKAGTAGWRSKFTYGQRGPEPPAAAFGLAAPAETDCQVGAGHSASEEFARRFKSGLHEIGVFPHARDATEQTIFGATDEIARLFRVLMQRRDRWRFPSISGYDTNLLLDYKSKLIYKNRHPRS